MIKSAKRASQGGRRWVAAAAVAATIPVALAGPTLATAPESAAALPDQLKVVTLATYPGLNTDDHGGIMCTGTRTCSTVAYPYLNRGAGADDLQAALVATDFTAPLVVFGYSQGATVVGQWLGQHADTVGAPTPQQVSFLLIGNPNRRYGGTHVRYPGTVTPDTDYQIVDVSRQYDRASDWPDNPMNLIAFLNASAGLTGIHTHYEDVDIYDPRNYVWKEGNTIYVFVPTDNIPLLDPLRKMGLDKLADELNGPLKAKIEKGYDRSYLPNSPGWPPDLLPPIVPPTPEPEPQNRTATSLKTAVTNSPEARTAREAAAEDEPVTAPEFTAPDEADIDFESADPTSPADAADTSNAKKSATDRAATRKRPFARLFERHSRSTTTSSGTAAGTGGAAADE